MRRLLIDCNFYWLRSLHTETFSDRNFYRVTLLRLKFSLTSTSMIHQCTTVLSQKIIHQSTISKCDTSVQCTVHILQLLPTCPVQLVSQLLKGLRYCALACFRFLLLNRTVDLIILSNILKYC